MHSLRFLLPTASKCSSTGMCSTEAANQPPPRCPLQAVSEILVRKTFARSRNLRLRARAFLDRVDLGVLDDEQESGILIYRRLSSGGYLGCDIHSLRIRHARRERNEGEVGRRRTHQGIRV